MFDDSRETRKIPSLYQTRWCIQGKAMQNLTKNFAEAKATLVSLTTEKILRSTTQANTRGLSKKAEKMKTFWSFEDFLTAGVLQDPVITPRKASLRSNCCVRLWGASKKDCLKGTKRLQKRELPWASRNQLLRDGQKPSLQKIVEKYYQIHVNYTYDKNFIIIDFIIS